MVDYSINSAMDLHFNEWDDFATVDAYEEFKQDVVKRLHSNERDLIRNRSSSDVQEEKIGLLVQRVAGEFDEISEITYLEVNRLYGEGQFEVIVKFETGDSFTETI